MCCSLARNETEYQQLWLGNWSKPQCSVRDRQGNHCPDEPVHFFDYNDKRVGLCERCYIAFQNGAFDYSRQKERAIEERLRIA